MTQMRRETRETRVSMTLELPGPATGAPPRRRGTGDRRSGRAPRPGAGADAGAAAAIATGDRFLDHMLATLARYAGFTLRMEAAGDLRHHLVEDTAITLGQALASALPETRARFGESTVAMDDALVQAVVDAGGRAYYEGPLPSRLYDHWMRSFATESRLTLHLRVIRGRDRHHVVEAAFKALGFALRRALADGGQVFSTKGAVRKETE